MSKINLADFYYGAFLSMLFNCGQNRITPVLLENDDNRRVYDLTTNKGEFRLFIKHRTDRQKTKTKDYSSWQFVFSDNELVEIKQYIEEGYSLTLGLVCGVKDLADSEIAVLSLENVKEILALDKKSITISRMKNEKSYRISIGGGRKNAIQVKANSFEEIFN